MNFGIILHSLALMKSIRLGQSKQIITNFTKFYFGICSAGFQSSYRDLIWVVLIIQQASGLHSSVFCKNIHRFSHHLTLENYGKTLNAPISAGDNHEKDYIMDAMEALRIFLKNVIIKKKKTKAISLTVKRRRNLYRTDEHGRDVWTS
ncbi:hypothetical protein BpHYR1_044915 [Brachionus plicatilis]|uniref:Uncharacterized protein n=1 Tax=Brachionus plicatilis TaxID=10195 RepID=A0A3M7Q4Z8_BRAPC|nr:hypothetical protein BpHYR1_044915 [Brachionus plicatilis]